MKHVTLVLLIASSLVFSQCCKKKKAMETATTEPVKTEVIASVGISRQSPEIKKITIKDDYVWPEKTDQFDLLSQKISGDSLILQVQYGGGCEAHEFNMFTNMMWMKSLPPQLNLWLEHKSNNDRCRALFTETISFDLKKCQYPGSHTVVFIINGDREKSVRYSY